MSSLKWPFCLDFEGWSGLRVLDVNGLKKKDHVEVHHHKEALGDNVLPNLNISVAFLVNCWALVTSLWGSGKVPWMHFLFWHRHCQLCAPSQQTWTSVMQPPRRLYQWPGTSLLSFVQASLKNYGCRCNGGKTAFKDKSGLPCTTPLWHHVPKHFGQASPTLGCPSARTIVHNAKVYSLYTQAAQKRTLGRQRVGIRQMATMYPHRYEFPDAADLGNLETLADLLNEKEQDFDRDAHHAAILVSLLQEWFFHLLSPNIWKAKPQEPSFVFP